MRHEAHKVRLIPAREAASEQSRREAILLMRKLASRNRLDRLRVKALIAEGRK